ncbi:MerR family transcriptional regulator [Amycolatopsis sp., V23-08]|uniref:MerR family transcriptional regulator n=1 Tax=Amycolatopsis heterodermiae TaxID=3110235 RepID=A0ABU5RCD2_9PSEU|nr:MerR family transcriptional regulator [Amycolatopsis sp., V23-08]MEA5363500.1 MerR family transcriptional regulator [Amycolatopsis sp., V23-08]
MDVRGRAALATWTPAKVAEVVGVSPVTLRSWAARYGVGPSLHEDGKHRRYSAVDVRRLQHMQRLIDRGMRAREAAATAFSGDEDAAAELSIPQSVQELGEAAEDLRFATIATVIADTLAAIGPAATWTEVVAPVLENLGGRWLRGQFCFEAEWALTTEVSAALQRFTAQYEPVLPGRPVLLACCPGERHSLPLEFLRAALLEVGTPALHLGQMVPAETTAAMATKLDPAVVMLWSIAPNTADELLADRLTREGITVCIAGPGWEQFADHGTPWVNDMSAAIKFLVESPA